MRTCEENEAERELETPPKKKLKQARLPFQVLTPGSAPPNLKKRKNSEDCDDIKVLKVVKPNEVNELDAKENLCVADSKQPTEEENGIKSNVDCIDTTLNTKVEAGTSEEGDVCTKKDDETVEEAQKTDETTRASSKIQEEIEDVKKEENSLDEVETKDGNEDSDLDSETNKDTKNDISDEGRKELELDSSSSQSDSEPENDVDSTPEVDGPSNSTANVNDSEKEKDPNSSKTDMEIDGKRDGECTPKRTQSGTPKPKKLTPKQLLQRQESAKKQEERKKLKLEKEKKRAAEKEEKQKMRLERREKKRKEREEREEQKKKEKDEKEKKKQAELEMKLEEKRVKEEERKKKDEEKRVKEEQRLLEKKKKDDEKLAKKEAQKKVAAAFANFFVPKNESKPIEETRDQIEEQQFMPFQVKVDMRLAPIVRRSFNDNRQKCLDKILNEQSETTLYLNELKEQSYIPGSSGKTWPLSEFQNEVVILEEDEIPVTEDNEVVESHPVIAQPKMKLLQFSENRRPPYWGSWRKKSKSVKPRCPFAKDEKQFDYEVDSDDEWEEEEPGESLHGSDDEKEKESEDEYEVDNEFFVPHGYLSEEENDCEGDETFSPETQKAKLKLLEMEFEEEMKHKTERIKPRLIGCYWASNPSGIVGASEQLQKLFSSYRAVFVESPIIISAPSATDSGSPCSESKMSTPGSARKKFPESAVPSLIRLVHGNINGRNYLVKEFSSHLLKEEQAKHGSGPTENTGENTEPATENPRLVSKLRISKKIKEIASWVSCPEEGPYFNRMCWFVPLEIRTAYGLDDLPVHHQSWVYINKPKRKVELSNTIPSPSISNEFNPRQKSAPLITKFTKKLSPEELQKQLQQENEIRLLNEAKVSDSMSSSQGNISSAKASSTGEPQDKKISKSLPLITKFTKKIDRDEFHRQKLVDDDIQFLKEEKSSSCSKTHDMLLDKTPKCSIVSVAHSKHGTKPSEKLAKDSSQGKLQLKVNSGGHKRVPLLMSVPLGQKIPPSSMKSPVVSEDIEMSESTVESSTSRDMKNEEPVIVID